VAQSGLSSGRSLSAGHRHRRPWGLDDNVHVWDLTSEAKEQKALSHGGKCRDAKFSPDGRRLATCSFDHTARVWDVSSGKSLAPPLRHPDTVFSVCFSSDG